MDDVINITLNVFTSPVHILVPNLDWVNLGAQVNFVRWENELFTIGSAAMQLTALPQLPTKLGDTHTCCRRAGDKQETQSKRKDHLNFKHWAKQMKQQCSVTYFMIYTQGSNTYYEILDVPVLVNMRLLASVAVQIYAFNIQPYPI